MFNQFRSIFIVTVVLILINSICLASNFPSQAIIAAEQFIAQLDNHKYLAAYKDASDLLHLSISEPDWLEKRERSGLLLGAVQGRKLVSIRARDTYPGFPDGDYLVVYFEAQTQRKQKAAEVVLVKLIANSWQVCSYRLK